MENTSPKNFVQRIEQCFLQKYPESATRDAAVIGQSSFFGRMKAALSAKPTSRYQGKFSNVPGVDYDTPVYIDIRPPSGIAEAGVNMQLHENGPADYQILLYPQGKKVSWVGVVAGSTQAELTVLGEGVLDIDNRQKYIDLAFEAMRLELGSV